MTDDRDRSGRVEAPEDLLKRMAIELDARRGLDDDPWDQGYTQALKTWHDLLAAAALPSSYLLIPQVDLPEDAAKVLRENAWDLYGPAASGIQRLIDEARTKGRYWDANVWRLTWFPALQNALAALPSAAGERSQSYDELIEWLLGERGDFPLEPEPLRGFLDRFDLADWLDDPPERRRTLSRSELEAIIIDAWRSWHGGVAPPHMTSDVKAALLLAKTALLAAGGDENPDETMERDREAVEAIDLVLGGVAPQEK